MNKAEETPSENGGKVKKMPLEVAQKEVNNWFETYRVGEPDEALVDRMASLIQEGNLVINSDGNLTYELMFPLVKKESGEPWLSAVTIGNRLNYNQVEPYLKGIKQNDSMGMVHGYACGLIDKPQSTFKKLDTRDSSFIRQIATFFV